MPIYLVHILQHQVVQSFNLLRNLVLPSPAPLNACRTAAHSNSVHALCLLLLDIHGGTLVPRGEGQGGVTRGATRTTLGKEKLELFLVLFDLGHLDLSVLQHLLVGGELRAEPVVLCTQPLDLSTKLVLVSLQRVDIAGKHEHELREEEGEERGREREEGGREREEGERLEREEGGREREEGERLEREEGGGKGRIY